MLGLRMKRSEAFDASLLWDQCISHSPQQAPGDPHQLGLVPQKKGHVQPALPDVIQQAVLLHLRHDIA